MKRRASNALSRTNPLRHAAMAAVLAALAAPAVAQLKAPSAPSGKPSLSGNGSGRTSGIFLQQPSQQAAPPSEPQMGVPQPGQKRSQLVDEVVAVVNNSVITRRELLDRADEIESQLRAA